MLKFLAKLVVRLIGLCLAIVLLSLAYLHSFGLPQFLQEFLVEQLARAGIAAQFSSIRLDLLRGVVATDAVLADAKTPNETLAKIDELELQLNIPRLLRRQNALGGIRIANAVLGVPTPPDESGSGQFTASDAYATFRFDEDGTIEIDRLTGLYCGIRLNVSGRLKPRAVSAEVSPKIEPAAPAAGRGQFQFITRIVRELNRIKVTLPPQLDMDFNLDLARPMAGRVAARLRGTDLTYRSIQLDSVAVDVAMRNGAIEIEQFGSKLYGGELSITGRYDIAMGRFDLNFSSSTDPTAFAPLLPEQAVSALRELRVHENPKITARYSLSPDTGSLPLLHGAIEAGELEFRGVHFRAIQLEVQNQGPEITLANVLIVTREGQLLGHGQYHIESSDFDYEIDSTIDPTKLLPLMTPVMKRIVEPAWFATPPHIVATVSGDFVDPDAFSYDAEVRAGVCSYRGVPLQAVSATLRLRQSTLDVQSLELKRREGELRGTLLADFNEHRVAFDLDTTANPTEMAGLLGEKAARTMKPYRFGPRTTARAKGLIAFEEPLQTAWTAQVANDGFSYWKFTADRAEADLTFTNNSMRIENFDADFYDGKLRGWAGFSFADPEVTYRFEFDAERADVSKLLEAIHTGEREVTGFLKGKMQLEGRGADFASLRGDGELEVVDGVLWQAPLFGIFSRVLGNTKATSAKATFTIANETVKTDDLQIAAGAFTAQSRGKLGFDGKMDFRVEAQFLRAWPGINIISKIIGQIMEYKVGGTLGSPSYRPVNLPKELMPHGS